MNEKTSFLCLDLGNTTCRGGIWSNGKIYDERIIQTKHFLEAAQMWMEEWHHDGKLCYCSVVPEAEKTLQTVLTTNKFDSTFCLTAVNQTFLPITYPCPEEIGADRIANSYAVFKSYPLPAIVIDLGTATTFDVISKKGGYLGGVIVPGPQGMLDYLGKRTALLPHIDLSINDRPVTAIGKSTNLAMMSGLSHGYLPMLKGILRSISTELENSGETIASVIQTGGEAKNFFIDGAIIHHSLTLEGLALACFDQQSDN